MSTHEHLIAMPVRSTGAGSRPGTRAKAIVLEAVQALSETARGGLCSPMR